MMASKSITLSLLIFIASSIADHSTTTMCEVVHCNTCSTTPTQCSLCENNYTLYMDSTTSQTYCVSVECNISSCRICQKDNICKICHTGFYLSNEGTCVEIKQQSKNKLSVTMSILVIECNITNCLSCSSPNFCSSCSESLYVNYQGNLCVQCTVPNCNFCSSDNVCYTCASGYQLLPASHTCIICNIPGCALCSNSSYCQNCSFGYIRNQSLGICLLCTFPCLTCAINTTNYCQTCLPNFSNQSNDGVCFTCATPNCFYCQFTKLQVCLECQTNYTLKEDHTCSFEGGCSTNCIVCSVDSVCAECKPGFAVNLTGKGQCFPCKDHKCITCSSNNASICILCNAGLYPQQDGKCTECPFPNCQSCNSTTCLSFKANLNQSPVFYNGSVFPVVNDPGCENTSFINPIACITCQAGYTLNSNRLCVSCAYPCLQCAPSSPQLCLSCYNNAFLNQSTCLTCTQSSQCLTCSPNNLSVCTSCPAGSILNNVTLVCSSNVISNCGNFCLTCLTPNICSVCMSGYSKNLQGQCLPCVNKCRVCPDNNQGLCIQCGTGFYVGILGNCIQCSVYCLNCYAHGCIKCAPGFYISSDFTCVPVCVSPCATCALNSTNNCTSCLLGYTLNSLTNQCIPQTSNCTDQGCYYCPIGFINSNSPNYTCIQCSSSSNCARCNPNNISLCLTCINGYYLSTDINTCLVCPPNCMTCTSSFSCTVCAEGYFLPVQPVQVPGLCVACQSPCALCFSNPYTCLSCINGYSLNGWNCQSNFNFLFSLILNVSATEFYNNYNDLLQTLVGPLNNSNNIGAVTVTSIATLKTSTIQGTLSTNQKSNTAAAGNQFHSLAKIFSSGTIVNMTIIFSQLVVSGGTIPQPETDNTNLGLILGISLPLTFIFILILVVAVYRRIAYRGPQQEQLLRQQNSALEIYNRSN